MPAKSGAKYPTSLDRCSIENVVADAQRSQVTPTANRPLPSGNRSAKSVKKMMGPVEQNWVLKFAAPARRGGPNAVLKAILWESKLRSYGCRQETLRFR